MQLKSVEYERASDEGCEALAAHGAVVIQHAPVDDDAGLLELCARFGVPTCEGNGPPPGALIRDLVWRPEDGDQEQLVLHTDSVFAEKPNDLMALACRTPADAGHGTSLIVHADGVVEALSDVDVSLLRSRPVRFVKERNGIVQQTWTDPVLEERSGAQLIRFHREHAQSPNPDPQLDAALARLIEVLDGVIEPATWRLGAGEVLLLDNRRVLHGRTPIAGSKQRVLRRVKLTAHFREPLKGA